MSDVLDLLSALRAKNVGLWLENGQLSYDAPSGVLTAADLDRLRAHKTEIVAILGRAGGDAAPRLEPADRSRAIPLSLSQERLWFIDQLERAADAYRLQSAVKIQGALDRSLFESAINDVVARHEVLRTIFPSVDGAPSQVILDERRIAVVHTTVAERSPSERTALIQARAAEEMKASFDLTRDPLLRVVLVHVSSTEHVLLLTCHHIIADAWSTTLVIREIAAAYQARRQRTPATLAPLPVQYADYAVWERACARHESQQNHRAYWQKQLEGAPRLLELPYDRPRPAVFSYRGASREFGFGPELTERLRAFARRNGATMFMVLHAAWTILLSRLSGKDDIVVGVPVSSRRKSELESLVGLFVNTLALRVRLDDDPSVEELVRRVKATTLESHAHQETPFEQVVEGLAPPRTLSHHPVFQVMFALQNTPEGVTHLSGADSHAREASKESAAPGDLSFVETGEFTVGSIHTARFDLTVWMGEVGPRIAGAMNFATDLFDASTIDRWIGHFEQVLTSMVEDATRKVSAVALLSSNDRATLDRFSSMRAEHTPRQTVHELFEEHVRRAPERLALTFGTTSLTYAELDRRANRLAHHLRSAGAGPETIVAICLEPSIDMIVALLGVLKTGAAYLPIDVGHPGARIAYMLDDAKPALIVAHRRFEELLGAAKAPRVWLDTDADAIAARPDTRLEPSPKTTPQSLLYIMYTSGTTGRPKGVLIEHANMVRLFSTSQEHFGFGENDVWALFHSFAFDLSIWEICGALMYGGRLVVVPKAVTRSPQDFYRLLCEQQVTVLTQTPTAFYQLAAAQAERTERLEHALRYVVFAGEALRPTLLRGWVERNGLDRPQLVNMYGITETTVHTTFHRVSAEEVANEGHSIVGRALADLEVHLLDERRNPVPIGCVGEIYVGGAGVARGYLNLPELTAERFIRHPSRPDARLYKSGDIARWRPDGTIEYLGRNDNQIKIRGYRVELGEIEAHLREHDGVGHAVVLVHQGDDGEKRLIAYTTGSTGRGPDADALRAHLKKRVADYMVPSAFVSLAELPLTQNGKLDREALRRMEVAPSNTREYVAPRNDVESKLCAIWSEVLKSPQVGVRDDFFALGGDSILSIKIVSKAKAVGLELKVEDVFVHATVEELAQALSQARPANALAPIARFELLSDEERAALEGDASIEDAFPLSTLQAGMYFHTELNDESAIYHDIFSHRIDLRFDEASFSKAVHALVERHPMLRTSFRVGADYRMIQVVSRKGDVRVVVEDISSISGAEQDKAIDAWMEKEKKHRFVWSDAPLLRMFVHRRGEGSFQFTLSFHHAILDGWSVATLNTELFEHYRRLLSGRDESPIAPKSTFRDYIALEQKVVESKESRAFWTSLLEDCKVSELPRHPDEAPGAREAEGRHHLSSVGTDLYRNVVRTAAELGVSVKVLLMTAHVKVMSCLYGQQDVLTGEAVNGRLEEDDGERALGLYVNTVPLRVKLGGESWADLVRRLHAHEQSVMPHRRYPLQLIQHATGGRPLFDTLFNYTHFHVYNRLFEQADAKVPESRDFEQTNFGLVTTFAQVPSTETLFLTLLYDPAVLAASQVEQIAEYYRTALGDLTARPHEPHAQASLLSAAERRRIVGDFNATDVAFTGEAFAHRLFEDLVTRAPGLPALIYGNRTFTYAELNRRSNQVAHHLRGLGVKPDSVVAISVERTPELVIGILGILKAGGAYLPLDPAYASERSVYMLSNATPAVILTEDEIKPYLPETTVPVVSLDGGWSEIAKNRDTNISPSEIGLAAHHLAYLIYTSGSSGQPKGVMVEHRNLTNFVRWALSAYSVDELRDTLFSTSANFDFSIFELFVPLAAGCAIHLISSGADLSEATAREITAFDAVPSLLSFLVSSERITPTTRVINVGGEVLTKELWEQAFARTGIDYLVNGYGPTETTTFATTVRMARGERFEAHIGKPLTNARVYILDENKQPVPIGVAGEIYIGGAGVARGYLNRPDLTAAAFFDDPFRSDGSRMYRSGDLGRFRPDGNIEFLGRRDHQVKIRGFRIELEEIEAHVRAHARVDKAVVTVHEAGGDKRIVAYVVAKAGEASNLVADLRAKLRDDLPDYMLPSAFVVLNDMPLTPSGKIDRRALPAPDPTAIVDEDLEPPKGKAEELLASLWQSVLGVERIGRNSDFFALGGHSLQATQTVSRVREIFAVDLPLRTFYDARTIAEVTQEIARLRGGPRVVDEIAETFARLEALSDEEVQRLLAEQGELPDDFPNAGP